MRILVTGGTGFVGRHIIETLLIKGHEVVTLARNTEKAQRFISRDVVVVKGDVLDKESVKKAFPRIDAVIHIVGIIVEARGEGTFRQIHFEGTKNVVDAAIEAGVKRYVHMSALGAEKDALSEYHKTKFMAEEYVISSGLDYTIFKPSVIHGRGDAFVNMYAGMMKLSPFIPVIGDGTIKMQPVYVKDVAKMFCMAVLNDKHIGKVYEAGGPQKLSFDEIVDAIAKAKNKRVYKIHLPIWFMKITAAVMSIFMKKPPISKDQLIMLQKDNACDIERIKEDFAIEPLRFEEGIKKYLV